MQPSSTVNAVKDMDIIRQAITWAESGRKVALASVVDTWGSAPRPTGSQAVINDGGDFAGSVSGGCIEGEVVTESFTVMRDGVIRDLSFRVSDDMAAGAGLACGGKVRVIVTPVTGATLDVLKKLDDRLQGKAPTLLAFDLRTGEASLMSAEDGGQAAAMLAGNKSGTLEAGDNREVFARVFNPPLRLVIVGAVHIAQALANLGHQAEFDVIVIDPRDTWGTEERFPGTKIDRRWPSTAMEDLAPDGATAVVMLSHDSKLDDPALSIALNSEAFYVGALGSRKTHAKRTARLRTAGFPDEAIDRIHAPIGLDIGANSPFEIALSIMAEIVAAHRGRLPAAS